MEKQNINDYFIMLGKMFEWICFEGSGNEVELSAVYKDKWGDYHLKSNLNDKSELCIATITSTCKAYDNEHSTNYYEKFEYARKNGVLK